jgi:hypothetical protein
MQSPNHIAGKHGILRPEAIRPDPASQRISDYPGRQTGPLSEIKSLLEPFG